MMATTELDKIPETVLSRSQVYEFRTISTKAIADQLRRIVDAEGITVGDESLQLIARDAEGSMRDAQSKLDQVIAFTGKTITGEDVATVLGLVGRDLLLDAVQAVADENAPAAFELAGRAVEMGYDLRAVCRELSRVVRDLLVLTVDPVAHQRSGDRRRNRARSAEDAGRAVLARGSAAGVRSADPGGGGDSRRGAAAVSPRDGAAALDPPAEAGADRGADCRRGVGLEPVRFKPSLDRGKPSGVERRPIRTPTSSADRPQPALDADSRSDAARRIGVRERPERRLPP